MSRKLAQELMDAARSEGAAVKRKEDLHRVADIFDTYFINGDGTRVLTILYVG